MHIPSLLFSKLVEGLSCYIFDIAKLDFSILEADASLSHTPSLSSVTPLPELWYELWIINILNCSVGHKHPHLSYARASSIPLLNCVKRKHPHLICEQR